MHFGRPYSVRTRKLAKKPCPSVSPDFPKEISRPSDPGTSQCQGRVVLPAALRDLKPQDLAVLVARRHRMEPVRDGMPMKAMGLT